MLHGGSSHYRVVLFAGKPAPTGPPQRSRLLWERACPAKRPDQALENPGRYSISMITCSCHICGSFFEVASQASAFLIG
ncbi:hypothetical protein D3C79_1037720 [compost metagenome]